MSTSERMIELHIAKPQAGVLRFAGIVASAAKFWRAFVNRRTANRLDDLDDHQLNDIGLTRLELHMTLRETGFASDPTKRLSSIAYRRSMRD